MIAEKYEGLRLWVISGHWVIRSATSGFTPLNDMDGSLAMKSVPLDYTVWSWESQVVRVEVDRLGVGPTVLLLPALSSISTRREMRLLQERLASNFTTVAIVRS
jgi:hypothetical protein